MAKPTNLAEWATAGGAAVTEPTLLEKQLGWLVAQKPPAQWFNWWQREVHRWIVWLDAFESTAHVWTGSPQTFNARILANGLLNVDSITAVGNGTGTALLASSTNAASVPVRVNHTGIGGTAVLVQANAAGGIAVAAVGAAYAISGAASAANGVGVYGEGSGASGGAGGKFVAQHHIQDGMQAYGFESTVAGQNGGTGGFFVGGAGQDLGPPGGYGGTGIIAVGGDSGTAVDGQDAAGGATFYGGNALGDGSLGNARLGGVGFSAFGGNCDGTQNDAGAAGVGASIRGGDITSDGNSRKGGIGLILSGGTGGAGRGNSLQALGNGQFDGGIQFYDSAGDYTSGTAAWPNRQVKKNVIQALGCIGLNTGTINITGNLRHQISGVSFPNATTLRVQIAGNPSLSRQNCLTHVSYDEGSTIKRITPRVSPNAAGYIDIRFLEDDSLTYMTINANTHYVTVLVCIDY